MTQEVDAQVEWTTEADLAEDTDAQMALSEDVVDEVLSDPDPSALISTLQQQLDQLKKDFADSKHVTNRATSSLDRLNNRLDEFATREELESTNTSIAGIRSLMDIGLSDVMSEEGKSALAEQRSEDSYARALTQAKQDLRQEINGDSPNASGQVSDEQIDEGARRAQEASQRVYGYAEAKGIPVSDVAALPIWDSGDNPGKTIDEAVSYAKEYIDNMADSNPDSRLAQRKQAAGEAPSRASSSSQVLTFEKLKNMSPQEIMKIPKDVRNKALRGG